MKKHLLLSFLPLLLASALHARPVAYRQAYTQARLYLSKDKTDTVDALPVSFDSRQKARGITTPDASPVFYVFNASDEEGFVVVAGDDEFSPIVAYSAEGSFPSAEAMPDALRLLLDNYEAYVEGVRAGEALSPRARASESQKPTVVVAPLLRSRWGQDEPYNLLTPDNWPVGCVATALSQIMYYWQWPETGTGSVAYNNGAGAATIDFSQSQYNWAKMKNSYSVLDARRESGQIVAKLCLDCGVATHMVYGESGSGTNCTYVVKALAGNFRYSGSRIRYYRADYFESRERWNSIIYSELAAGRPIFFAATSSSGSGSDAAGHAYVVDGCDSEGLVHINWGWTGSYNGYFAIADMDPGAYHFSLNQQMVVGIQPDRTGADNEAPQIGLVAYGVPRVQSNSVDVAGAFTIEIDTLGNYLPYNMRYTLGIELRDSKGNLIEENVAINDNTLSINAYHLDWSVRRIACRLSTRPADGDYMLRLVSRQTGYTDYALPFTPGGHSANRIPAYIHDGRIYFNQVSSAISSVETGDFPISSIEFYNLRGQRVTHPDFSDEIVIERVKTSDGIVKTRKYIKR